MAKAAGKAKKNTAFMKPMQPSWSLQLIAANRRHFDMGQSEVGRLYISPITHAFLQFSIGSSLQSKSRNSASVLAKTPRPARIVTPCL
jgi:hypothetical protein